MKKMFFTAIALVAFSGVSMAETAPAVEEELVTCETQAAMDTHNYEQVNGCLSSQAQTIIYYAYLAYCRSLTKTTRLIEG
ncbi:MAG: hypothetical protein M0D53_08635 [Flavobacterium sp. JAD_PAG50586_2]|nr:MAG: hypothetical protein M0D53_08635 [Flavobacterium sp. JAD_PAG50586_2]